MKRRRAPPAKTTILDLPVPLESDDEEESDEGESDDGEHADDAAAGAIRMGRWAPISVARFYEMALTSNGTRGRRRTGKDPRAATEMGQNLVVVRGRALHELRGRRAGALRELVRGDHPHDRGEEGLRRGERERRLRRLLVLEEEAAQVGRRVRTAPLFALDDAWLLRRLGAGRRRAELAAQRVVRDELAELPVEPIAARLALAPDIEGKVARGRAAHADHRREVRARFDLESPELFNPVPVSIQDKEHTGQGGALTLLHGCAAPPAPRNHVPRRWLSQYSANVRAASARPLKTRPIASSPVALKLTSLSTSSTRGARPALIKRSCSRRATALRFLSPAALTTLFSSAVFAPPRPRCRRRCISPSMSDSSKSSSEVSSCAIARNAASLLSATLVSSRACIWDTAAAGSPDTRLRI